jgi:hypothetical protein
MSKARRSYAAREFAYVALDSLAREDWTSLRADLCRVWIVGCSECGTVPNHTIGVLDQTLVNGLDQCRYVPTIDKVSVKPEAGHITIGEDEFAITADEGRDGVQNFVEKMREQNRVTWWANAVINFTEMCNVRLVREVEVFAIPTGWHMYLGPKSVGAVHVGHVDRLRSSTGGIVDTDHGNGFRYQARRVA